MLRVEKQIKDVRKLPAEKDETDTQVAVTIAINELHASQINIFGATGGRLDHLLANFFLVLEERFRPYATRINLVDRQNVVQFFTPGKHVIEKIPQMKYLAFINLTAVKNLNLIDEKYSLKDFSSDYPISWASNEFVGQSAHFSFDSGMVAVIQSRDFW